MHEIARDDAQNGRAREELRVRYRADRLIRRRSKTPCPKCGSVVQRKLPALRLHCAGLRLFDHQAPGQSHASRYEEVEQLLHRASSIGPLQGFISKMGRPFAAVLKITPEHKLEFDFGQTPARTMRTTPSQSTFPTPTPLGACPKCRSPACTSSR
jgi:DNA topoisomerase III